MSVSADAVGQPMDGVVLAGGRSRRLGRDKVLLTIDGQRLVDRAVATLQACCGAVVVASGARHIPGLQVPQIPDVRTDAGPMAAILSGMEVHEGRLLAVLAADHVRPSAPLLMLLAGRWDGSSVAVVAEVAGRLQPLHAVWSRAAAPALRRALDEGERSPVRWLASAGAQVVRDADLLAAGIDPGVTCDVDVPADLADLERRPGRQ